MLILEALSGHCEPTRLVLDEAMLARGVVLGRSRDVDMRMLSEAVSRRHATIDREGGRVVLRDLGSANGTMLNEKRLAVAAALFDGDEIVLGEVRLRYRAGEDADRPTAALPLDDKVEAAVDPLKADPAREAENAAMAGRLRLVCAAATAATDARGGTELGERLLEEIALAFAPDRATIALARPEGTVEVLAGKPDGAQAPRSRTIRRRVLEGKEAVLLRDAHEAEAEAGSPSLAHARFRSTMAAPLLAGSEVLGLLAVEAIPPDRYNAADLEALAAVARQAALALRNLRALGAARAVAASAVRAGEHAAPPILGASPAIGALRERTLRAAAADSPVLVVGETGTGKELVARQLHARGPHPQRPFVALNCAALVDGLLESELFGHEKGAFTGAVERREGQIAAAGEGTLFLDEIGDMPLAMQAKLLRVLAERTYTRVGGSDALAMRCRVVAATNRNLEREVAAGTFREDLWYRLAVVVIDVPPLRERIGDVSLLAVALLERKAAAWGRRVPHLSGEALARLERHRWPGNVRELENALERALVLLEGDEVSPADLPPDIGRTDDAEENGVAYEGGAARGARPALGSLAEAERQAIAAALEATGGRKGATAARLGISWPTLNRKLREFGLGPRD